MTDNHHAQGLRRNKIDSDKFYLILCFGTVFFVYGFAIYIGISDMVEYYQINENIVNKKHIVNIPPTISFSHVSVSHNGVTK